MRSPLQGLGARAARYGRRLASTVYGPDLPVCAGERLVGIVPVERLLAAGDDALLESLMDRPVAVASPDDDQERVASLAARSGARSVAVVDESGRFLHMVPPESVIAVLSEEHEEDLARIGGFLARSGSARTAAEEDVRLRLWHRLPWLAIGLAARWHRPASWPPSRRSSSVRCCWRSSSLRSSTWLMLSAPDRDGRDQRDGARRLVEVDRAP